MIQLYSTTYVKSKISKREAAPKLLPSCFMHKGHLRSMHGVVP